MNYEEEVWDICKEKKNFKCILHDRGRWDRGEYEQEVPIFGKWVFTMYMLDNNPAPTLADQKNFISGLLEVVWRNDNFKFPNGLSIPPQAEKNIGIFRKEMDKYEEKVSNRTIAFFGGEDETN